MTDRSAGELKSQLDAMRLVRAEDHRACARLAARVKELEDLVPKLRGLLSEAYGYAPTHLMVRITALLGAGHQHQQDQLADGTRDETAERCDFCSVPIHGPRTTQVQLCGTCALKVLP